MKASHYTSISKFDLLKGFHKVPMAEEDIKKTSFSTPWGKWEYKRMLFGIKNSPSHFQRCMSDILGNTQASDVHIDNIIVYSRDFKQHLQDLGGNPLPISRPQSQIVSGEDYSVKDTMEFLGHTIGSGRITPKEIEALKEYPRPTTKRG